jgi:hypothetical protein
MFSIYFPKSTKTAQNSYTKYRYDDMGLNLCAQFVHTVSLTWTASTDNVGVTGYDVIQDGAKKNTSNISGYTVKICRQGRHTPLTKRAAQRQRITPATAMTAR